MTPTWVVPVLTAIVTAQVACAPKPKPAVEVVRAPRAQTPKDLIVLLRDSDGLVGAAAVWNRLGAMDLSADGAATNVSVTQGPSAPEILTDLEIREIFGDVLSSLPLPPQRFTLHFRFESEELTAESRRRVADIVAAVQNYPASEVVVVGHTDTTGASLKNFQLAARGESSLPRSHVCEVASHVREPLSR